MNTAAVIPTASDSDPCLVVGLGNIGGAIGERLAASGAHVAGVDLVDELRSQFSEATGAPTYASLAAAPLDAISRVVVVVRLADQACTVLETLAEAATPLTAFVVTTLDLETAQRLGTHATSQLGVVELPVSGGRGGALAGTLTAMAAGPLSDADRTFITTHLAAKLVEFDDYGEPTAAKLHNNVLAAFHVRAHADVLLAAAQRGIDPAKLSEVLDSSSGASWMGVHLAVIVDDLLEKDVALYEASYGAAEAVAVGDGSGLADTLERARQLLASQR